MLYIYIYLHLIPFHFYFLKMPLHYRYYKISYLCTKKPLRYGNLFYILNLFKYHWLLKSFSSNYIQGTYISAHVSHIIALLNVD